MMIRYGLFFIWLSIPSISTAAEEFNARVFWVVDGDTIKIEQRVRNVRIEETCRMLGYNAPEMKGKERPLGIAAKRKIIELIAYKNVKVRSEGKDKYGRLLCVVILPDGQNVNETMRAWLESEGYEDTGKYDRLDNVSTKNN